VNQALVFVLIAVAGGLAALLALQSVAPHLGPAIALAVTAAVLLAGSMVKGNEGPSPTHSTLPAGESTAPF
jgi:hypothetical protein